MSQSIRASRRKYHMVYKTTCLTTGRYYIGMHSTDDLDDRYLGSGLRLSRSVKKYGRDQHVREILELLPSRADASLRESEIITPELRADPLCMNCGPGGLGAIDRPATTEETRRKCSEAAKAGWVQFKERGYSPPNQTERAKAKRAEALRGQKRTPEQLEKLSAGQRKYHAENKEVVLERSKRAGEKKCKQWKFTFPTGEERIVKGLKQISLELGISQSALYHAANRQKQVNGITVERVNT